MWTVLANISAVITAILFIVYFIGRFMAIFKERSLYYDKIELKPEGSDLRKYDIVESFPLQENINNVCIITSKNGIWNLNIYENIYDDGYNRVLTRKLVHNIPFLQIGQSVAIHFDMPEIFPMYAVEYNTADYRLVKFELHDNLKNGIVSELVYPTHTWKSILYFLFR